MMNVNLTPDMQAQVDRWVADTGRSTEELVQDAVAAYFEVLSQVRTSLDSRYDEVMSGAVQPVDGEEVRARMKARTQERRTKTA